jgi:GTP-binding protein Era
VFSVIDTPGVDAAGAVGESEREKALAAAREADLLVVLFDATHGIGETERQLYLTLASLGIPMIVVLNKMDLVVSERAAVVGRSAQVLGLDSEQVIPLSAKTGTGIERLLLATAKSEPGIVAALGRALPAYRWKLAQVVIGRATSTAAVIALTPLPFLSFFPLVAVQSAMVLSIARIHAFKITLARARELLATFGLGLLGRTLFYELSKFGGPPGWLLSAAVASGTTASMGYAAAVWFGRGERIAPETLRQIGKGAGQAVVDRLKGMGRRRLRGRAMEEQVTAVLEGLPAPVQDQGQDEAKREAPHTSPTPVKRMGSGS